MKDKERLLSFEEPTRFIFSHSALKEGWDNPNVFQICALKNAESGSHTRRRQEVGRGMRLCVNKHGTRQDVEAVGEQQVHEINRLTVIAPESYEAFAEGLQKEIAATLKDRPQKAGGSYFVGKVLLHDTEGSYRLTETDAQKLSQFLYRHGVLDADEQITPLGKQLIGQQKLTLPEHLVPFQEAVAQLLRSVYTGETPKPEDERQIVAFSTNQALRRKEFQALWHRINLKTNFEVRLDTDKLIHDSKARINAQLHIPDQAYEVKTGEQQYGTKEQLLEGTLIKEENHQRFALSGQVYANARYDVVGEMEALTDLTRSTIVAILKAIQEEKFLLLRKNPEAFVAGCSKLINEVKASLVIHHIICYKTEDRYEANTLLTNTKLALRYPDPLQEHLSTYAATLPTAAAAFARALEASTEVIVYEELPRSLEIFTPVANYRPDRAIVLDQENERHLYFITETKGLDSGLQAHEVAQPAMHNITVLLKQIVGEKVSFGRVSTYEELLAMLQSEDLVQN